MGEAEQTRPIALHSTDAEEALLGAVMINDTVLTELARIVKPVDFHNVRCGIVWQVYLDLRAQQQAIDFVTVTDELERSGRLSEVGGASEIARLTNVVPTAVNADSYAQIVAEYAERRRYLSAAGVIANAAYEVDAPIDEVRNRVSGSIRGSVPSSNATVDAKQAAHEAYERAGLVRQRALEHPGEQVVAGERAYVRAYDELTGGFADGSMNLLAARPGIGKSSMARQIALEKAQRGERVLYFSFEMPRVQIMDAMACSLARVDSTKLRHGRMTDEEWQRVTDAYAKLSELPLHINDDSLTSAQMYDEAMLIKERYGDLALIIVDYIGLVALAEKGENTNAKTSVASRMMKKMGMKIAETLVLVQLSRAAAKEARRPTLTDLRDSGSLEQDGDTVMFLHREGAFDPEYQYQTEVELILAKNRHGSIGTGVMVWEGAFTHFRDAEKSEINAVWLEELDERDRAAGATLSSEYIARKQAAAEVPALPKGVKAKPKAAPLAPVGMFDEEES